MINEAKRPLVSVVVITYNSSGTVVETLDSIKAQTYQHIELVVSDDCSTDNTVEIVDNWLRTNGSCFKNVVKVFSDINTGIPANDNRGIKASSGFYVKAIAGDDCLVETAIEEFVKYMETEHYDFCISDLELFTGDSVSCVPDDLVNSYKRYFEHIKESREEKIKRLAYEYVLISPGYFYKREVYDKVGGYDERFPMSEEVPFAMRVLKAGYQMYPLDKKLVRYRCSGNSLSQHSGKKLGNRRWFLDNRKIFYHIQLPELFKSFRWLRAYSKMLQYEQTNFAYKEGFFFRIIEFVLCVINPYTYYGLIRRIRTTK